MGEGEFGLSGVVPKRRSVTTAQSERLPQVAFFGSFLGEARKERPAQRSKVASLYRNIDEWYCMKAVPRANTWVRPYYSVTAYSLLSESDPSLHFVSINTIIEKNDYAKI